MNKYSFLSLLLVLAVSASSCSKVTPEIVEQGKDPLPTNPKGIDRSKIALPPVDLLTQYLFFQNNDQEVSVVVLKDETSEQVLDVDDVEVKISTSIPVETEFVAEVEVMTDKNAPKTYPNVVANGARMILPPEMYTLSDKTVTFKPGEKEKTLTLSFNKDALATLSEEKTYVIPFVLKIPEELKKTIKLHNFFLVSVTKQTILPLPNGDNISVGSSFPSGVVQVDPSELELSTNANTGGHLYKLIDGDYYYANGNWWVSDPNTYLDIKLPEKRKVKAIALWTLKYTKGFYSYDKSIRKMTVLASNNSGEKYFLQGNVSLDSGQKIVVVTFTQSLDIDALRLTGFEGEKYDRNPNGDVDINEIVIYAEQ